MSDPTKKIIFFPRHGVSECPSLMADWNAIKQEVENNGNVLTVTMKTLRNALGKAKLGVIVCPEISKMLSCMGLGHVPVSLPPYQHAQVRLYKRGTQMGDLFECALTPGPQKDTELRERFGVNRRKDVPANAAKHIPIRFSKLPIRLEGGPVKAVRLRE